MIARIRRRQQRTASGEPPRARDDAGAVLVLALMFLVVVGLIVGAMASWTANSLSNSLNFQQDRAAQYALSSASQVAIQNIRYTPLLGPGGTVNASPPSYCWGTSSPSQLTFGTDTVDVWCSTVWNPTSASTRVVTVSACLTSVTTDAATCAKNPGLQTIVTFDDYSASSPNIRPPGVFCTSTCGSGMTINSSTIKTTNPTVTNLSVAQGPVTGGTSLTVTGTGFVSGTTSSGAPVTTVNFVPTPASPQTVVIPGVNVNVPAGQSTSLTVTTPASTTVTSYYVVVTTPDGSSLAGPTFLYQPVDPVVTSIATSTNAMCGSTQPPCGSAAGGTSLTITGTGFLAGNGTTVNFIDTQDSSIVVPAQYIVVNSSTTITATTPAVTTGSPFTYYVTVTTAPGGPSGSTGPVFNYTPLTPVVASVSPTSGGSGTVLTITGIGFVSGATTVSLVPQSGGGGTLTATGVSVSSSTTLTATVPSGGSANPPYYVEVTTTSGGSSCPTGGCGSGGTPVGYSY